MNPSQGWQHTGIAFLRIITGLLMAYHGYEVFDAKTMAGYQEWDSIKALPVPVLMMYLAKSLEFTSGVLLALGLLTRVAAVVMAILMLFVCFKIGNGKFWYEDQHPFLFAMLAMVFFFQGGGKWSLDKGLFRKK